MSKQVVEVWTDGSGMRDAREKRLPGGFAFIALYGEKRLEGFGCLTVATSNQAELAAILAALLRIRAAGYDLVIYSDSRYSINAITVWAEKWERNGWTTFTGKSVANKGVLQAILGAIQEHKAKGAGVVFKHVSGHAGVPENERADYLAGTARKEGVCSPSLGKDLMVELERVVMEENGGVA